MHQIMPGEKVGLPETRKVTQNPRNLHLEDAVIAFLLVSFDGNL